MSGIYYALSIVAIAIVIRWFIRNDRLKPGEPTTGLLAIRPPAKPAHTATRKYRSRESQRQPPTRPAG